MNVQEQKTAGRARRRSAAMRGADGPGASLSSDVDVVRRVAAEPEKRTADRQSMIATAAYFRAQRRGFEPGHELDDWLAAEAEVEDLRPFGEISG